MTKRSLQASTTGMEKARKAFKRKAWTQEYLAGAVGIETRQPIWKFFTGKPIERHIFIDICFQLGLEWEEIAEIPTDSLIDPKGNQPQDEYTKIDTLVATVRSQHHQKILAQCGTMRLLDIAQPISLEDIYVNVNILETISGQRWLDISELPNFNQGNFDRLAIGKLQQEVIPAIDAVKNYSKLMVLGKPGSGKTTFLQNIALQSIKATLQPERIPIFIKLKNFVEDWEAETETNKTNYLRNYIDQQICNSSVTVQQVELLLNEGRFLILLDGLDEVGEKDSKAIIKQIRQLSEYYYKNQFIVTCRIAAQQYKFTGFTDIEIADFNLKQIQSFVNKWFSNVVNNSQEQSEIKANQFIQKLQLHKNKPIRELAVTPILLNLTCLVFEGKGDFPTKRADIYKQGLDILLIRWDKSRGINRDEIYQNLSLPHKLKLLSQIAAITFEKGDYFFEETTIQKYIVDYLQTLPCASKDPQVLQLESEAVLKSIEAQHGLLVERARGIYSFSHLTFQEYLTAKHYITNSDPEILERNLTKLVSHIHEIRWREVILLAAGMLENADYLLKLIKQYIDAIAASDEKIQKLLLWTNQKCLSLELSYRNAAIRAFYLTLDLPRYLGFARDLNLAIALDLNLAQTLDPQMQLDLNLNRILNLSLKIEQQPTLERILMLSLAFPSDRELSCQAELIPVLQQLKEELPITQSQENLLIWWHSQGSNWIKRLRDTIIKYRNICHDWQLNQQQQQTLQLYYDANRFLLDYLDSNFPITQNLREKIIEQLLLPVINNSESLILN